MASPIAHGTPCWFELGTADLDGASRFYQTLFGWAIEKTDMPNMDYRLASLGKTRIAGLMPLSHQTPGAPPNWIFYVAVDDCDATAALARARGGRVLTGPADIPGTGRFALLADPQGAVIGVLAMTPMPDEDAPAGAFDQQATGHGNWVELMSTDPVAALAFYGELFGWTAGEAMDMGAEGQYQLFRNHGADIGGMMGLGQAPSPCWLPYFGVDDITASMAMVKANGAKVMHGPIEVPGPALIAVLQDPQGAYLAIVGPKP